MSRKFLVALSAPNLAIQDENDVVERLQHAFRLEKREAVVGAVRYGATGVFNLTVMDEAVPNRCISAAIERVQQGFNRDNEGRRLGVFVADEADVQSHQGHDFPQDHPLPAEVRRKSKFSIS